MVLFVTVSDCIDGLKAVVLKSNLHVNCFYIGTHLQYYLTKYIVTIYRHVSCVTTIYTIIMTYFHNLIIM